MSTTTESAVETKRVNFLDFDRKTVDWRFDFHDKHFMESVSETIYWVGTMNLAEVEKDTTEIALSFSYPFGANLRSMKDKEFHRHEDGAPAGGSITCMYAIDHPDLKKEILEAKRKGMNFFHILIEETCDGYGVHSADLVYTEMVPESKTIRGYASKVPLTEIPLKDSYWLADLPIDKNTRRIQLLGHDRYHWHK